MDNYQFWTIVGLIVGSFGTLASIMIWMTNKHDGEIKAALNRIDAISSRLDGHATRIDQLYHMFVDMVKTRRN